MFDVLYCRLSLNFSASIGFFKLQVILYVQEVVTQPKILNRTI